LYAAAPVSVTTGVRGGSSRRGFVSVGGYPEAAGAVPAGFLFNGALSTYEQLGFTRDRQIGKHRWVMTRVVEPRS
jgi:hypothetical protein